MMFGFGASKLLSQITPALYVIRSLLPAYRGDLTRIMGVSGLSTFFEIAGVGLLYFLIQNFTGTDSSVIFSRPWMNAFLSSPLAITGACVLFLTASIRLKQLTIRGARDAALKAGSYAGCQAAIRVKSSAHSAELSELGSGSARFLVNLLLKDLPFACGFAVRGASMVSINLVQAALLCLVMLVLSPLLTLSLGLLALVFFGLLSGPFDNVLGIAVDRSSTKEAFQGEKDCIAESLINPEVTEQQLGDQAKQALDTGLAGEQLGLRLALRVEKASGSLIVEYVYPIALLAIALIYALSSDFAPDIALIAVYFLLLRQLISCLTVIGGVLVSFSRHQPAMMVFEELMENNVLPGKTQLERMFAADEDEE